MRLDSKLEQCLIDLCRNLIDQEQAVPIVAPHGEGTGFWFGGGNMAEDADGTLYLVGRYRNHGDSRNGVKSGIRGMELAMFRSIDAGKHFVKTASWSKEDLQSTMESVLSIEGSALRITDKGAELYVSTEKARPYHAEAAGYQKPGTGVWSIDVLKATAVEELKRSPVNEVLR